MINDNELYCKLKIIKSKSTIYEFKLQTFVCNDSLVCVNGLKHTVLT